MTELSENIKTSFANIQSIYEQIANLFSDVDDLMQQRGYRNMGRASVEAPFSKSLNYPRWWLVGSASRYYILDTQPEIARSIGIFFLDGQMQPIDPIVLMGVLKGKIDEENEEVDPFWVLWDAWNKELSDHSLVNEHTFKDFKKIQQGKLLAIPLEEIKDHESLEKMVIEPLLEMDWK